MSKCRVALPILGLSCGGGGAPTVERAICELDGVIEAYVNPATETAYVTYEPGRIGEDAIRRAIRKIGYESREARAL